MKLIKLHLLVAAMIIVTSAVLDLGRNINNKKIVLPE